MTDPNLMPWEGDETPDDCPWCGRTICDEREAHLQALEDDLSQEVPCPAAGGIPCGSNACRRYGCEDER